MIDFTPLVEALITLAVTAITVFLIPWLRERYGTEKLAKAQGWVQVAVLAAEKLYGAGKGDEKLAYVEAFLASHKIKLDTDALKAMVNAEIKKMENEAFPVEEIIRETIPPDLVESAAGGGLDE
jgi:hypothetical protein